MPAPSKPGLSGAAPGSGLGTLPRSKPGALPRLNRMTSISETA
ncbi:hypothetical protein WMF31_17280 [Sorangium sp. So ce1036]